jgi:hypothetical protein
MDLPCQQCSGAGGAANYFSQADNKYCCWPTCLTQADNKYCCWPTCLTQADNNIVVDLPVSHWQITTLLLTYLSRTGR